MMDKTEIGAMAFAAIGKKSLERLRNKLRPELTDDMFLLGLSLMASMMAGDQVQRLADSIAVFADDRANNPAAFLETATAFADIEKRAPSL
jgi:hypothetical protein